MKIISDKTGITCVSDEGKLFVISASDVSYNEVKEYVLSGGRDVEELIAKIMGSKKEITELAQSAVEVVDDGDDTYRTANNDPVVDVILETAIRVRRNGRGGSQAINAFLKRLKKNPTVESRSQLFAWLKAEGFTLTTDGKIIGYKGVSDDFLSISSGKEPVSVTLNGTKKTHTGRIPYLVGSKVSIPRNLVDPDRDAHCSVGIHVGTHAYASDFGRRVVLVLVDPRDVVSVPRDCNGQKMRVSRLVVLAEHTGDKIADTVMTIPDPVARKRYRARKGNEAPAAATVNDADTEASDTDADTTTTVADDPVNIVDVVAAAVVEKLKKSSTPLKKRDLYKRFSANRRDHLDAALDVLVKRKTIVAGDGGYSAVAGK